MNTTGIRVPILDTRTIATRIERRFVSCASCGTTSTVDLTVHCWEFSWYSEQAERVVWEPRTDYTDEEGKEYADGYIAQCPQCGAARPVSRRLKARYSAKRECNEKCKDAVSEQCVCKCGGANHGVSHKQQGLTLF